MAYWLWRVAAGHSVRVFLFRACPTVNVGEMRPSNKGSRTDCFGAAGRGPSHRCACVFRYGTVLACARACARASERASVRACVRAFTHAFVRARACARACVPGRNQTCARTQRSRCPCHSSSPPCRSTLHAPSTRRRAMPRARRSGPDRRVARRSCPRVRVRLPH